MEKEFKTGMRGYQQEEVDKFLDMIIKDYEAFHKEFDQLKQQNVRLKRELEEQKTSCNTSSTTTCTNTSCTTGI